MCTTVLIVLYHTHTQSPIPYYQGGIDFNYFFIVFETFLLLYGQTTKSADLPMKMAPNQKMQENKLALKFNFT